MVRTPVANLTAAALTLSTLTCHCVGDGESPGNPAFSSGTSSYAPHLTGWKVTFSDEFEGASGSPVDATKWNLTHQGDGFGNGELEFYTPRTDNASLDGEGNLVITALQERYQNHNYTSARLDTLGKFEQQYGRFEARIKLPRGQGIWPAFWMLGTDVVQVSWPDCGEIDIMEYLGSQPVVIYSALEGPGHWGGNPLAAQYRLPGVQDFADDFHVFAIEWEPGAIRFYVDEVLYVTRTPADLPAGARWVYDHPFYLLLHMAVGGYHPGPPDATTVFPQKMFVDYVRVLKREN